MKIALAHPELAPLLLAAVLIVALCAVALVRRRRALAAFAGTGARLASASPARQVTKLILVGARCLLVVVALVGPEIGEAPRRAPISTLDTIVALDISQSMAVRDVETDRLHVAQRAIELLGQQLSGGRVGLTLFGGSSVLRYPLTASTKIVGPALDTSGHGFHVQPGSSLQAALDGAAAQFPTTAADDLRTRAIVVVSDGEDPVPDLPVLDPYLARGIHVFTLGIGTPAGGPVPVYDIKGQYQQMLVDANGTQITSRLDEARLVNLATAGGGRYFRYENEGTVKTLSDALRATDMAVATTEGGLSAEDRYQIFLGVGLVLLIADWLLGERRPMPRPRLPRGRAAPRRRVLGAVSALLLLVVACGPGDPIADQLDAANPKPNVRPHPKFRSTSVTRWPHSGNTTGHLSSTAAGSMPRRGRSARSRSTIEGPRSSASDGSLTRARLTSRRSVSTRTIAMRSSTSRSSTASSASFLRKRQLRRARPGLRPRRPGSNSRADRPRRRHPQRDRETRPARRSRMLRRRVAPPSRSPSRARSPTSGEI